MSERRGFTRIQFNLPVQLILGDGRMLQGNTEDISMQGLLVSCEDAEVRVGQSCNIVASPEQSDPIDMSGEVVRVLEGHLALYVHGMSQTAYQYLQQLVRLNAENTDIIDAEFQAHIGLKRRA